jgi:hypothetical protein
MYEVQLFTVQRAGAFMDYCNCGDMRRYRLEQMLQMLNNTINCVVGTQLRIGDLHSGRQMFTLHKHVFCVGPQLRIGDLYSRRQMLTLHKHVLGAGSQPLSGNMHSSCKMLSMQRNQRFSVRTQQYHHPTYLYSIRVY